MHDYLVALPAAARYAVTRALEVVRREGTQAQQVRHLRGPIYEVRVEHDTNAYRVLFSPQGHYSQVLLSLEAFTKTTRRTPPQTIELAERRLADWERRGIEIASKKKG